MKFIVHTKGFTDFVDISQQVRGAVAASGVTESVAHLFLQGSTAALSTTEFEPGAVRDLKEALERIAPMDARCHHNEAWGDGNGYAQLRAALMKPSLSVPIEDGQLQLGN